ncbi:MAG: biotin synthase BioB [Spirochaetales bacterium]|nr:biotin synthase BioB [Spirochaetales bacterium]
MEYCAIINVRNGHCSENCAFCAQSAHHGNVEQPYELVDESILFAKADVLAKAGVQRYSLVASGGYAEDSFIERLAPIFEKLARDYPMALCASLGILTPAQAQRLKDVGVVRYHHNLETARSFYPQICDTHDFQERVDTVLAAQSVGLEVCSGGLWGLGESRDQRWELAEELAQLRPDSVPINVLTAMEGTPLAGAQRLSDEEIVLSIAKYRRMIPGALLRFCGGRQQLERQVQQACIQAGIGGVMVGGYLTVDGQALEEDLAFFGAPC